MNTSGNVFSSINPSDGSVVWEGVAADRKAIDRAVNQSRIAFSRWRCIPVNERIEFLLQFASLVERHTDELARRISMEVGKPFPEAKAESRAMAAKVNISIKAYQKRCSDFQSGPVITRFRPHGVLAVLGPCNFPGHLPNGHIVPALLAGNTVLFKPSELAPAVAELTMDLWIRSGLPTDVLQLLQGGTDTAKDLASHPGLDGLLFTGSAATGKALARQFAEFPGKVLALEMGGNNPLIVDTDYVADMDRAVEICLNSAFLSTGQRCTCARRLILIDSLSVDLFLVNLIRRTESLRIDDPLSEPPPFMGPLASPHFVQRVLNAQNGLTAMGAQYLLEARQLKAGTGFVSAGIIDVSIVANPPDEEIFGPLLQIHRVPDLDAAIKRANQTRFGLAAGFVGDDEDRYHFARDQLQAGIINWNAPLTGASSAAPFGGIGDSGNLRPAAFFAADYCSYPVASMEKA